MDNFFIKSTQIFGGHTIADLITGANTVTGQGRIQSPQNSRDSDASQAFWQTCWRESFPG